MADIRDLQVIWDALFDFQDYMQEGHDVFLSEADEMRWNNICFAMAQIHEALGIPQEELD